jgi:hypothetical protein
MKTSFDPSNPPAQPDATELLGEIASALGVNDPTDTDALQQAFASLVEAANGPGSAEGVAPPQKAAIDRGRAILNNTFSVSTSKVDPKAIALGAKAFGLKKK